MKVKIKCTIFCVICVLNILVLIHLVIIFSVNDIDIYRHRALISIQPLKM